MTHRKITTLHSSNGITHGDKPYKLNIVWDPVGLAMTVERNTRHQLHRVLVRLRKLDNGKGGVKRTPFFTFREEDHPTKQVFTKEIDIFELTHLIVNITDEERSLIVNRQPTNNTVGPKEPT